MPIQTAVDFDAKSIDWQKAGHDTSSPEVSVVMPCLDEAATLGACIDRVQRAFHDHRIAGEIIVADNGSTDGSQTLASSKGAHVVRIVEKGYGSALQGGIALARGKYVLMGDADGSYDFAQIPLFLDKLRAGFDLVMGNRFEGGIKPGAMRPLHRYLGVPVLTHIARLLFRSPFNDNHCGLRAFSKAAFLRMGLCATGWEFGSEMLLKANLMGMRVTEVPITLSPDGRGRPPHLRTWPAGWRHLRLMLLYCPRWLFFYPGLLLMLLGLGVGLWLMPGPRTVGTVTLNIHTLLYAATAILTGFQAITFAAFAQIMAVNENLLPGSPRIDRLLRAFSLELGVAAGTVLVVLGLVGSFLAVRSWSTVHFGPLDASEALRVVIPSVLSLTLGGHVVLSSLFFGVLKMSAIPGPSETDG